ncbi:MAG: AAA family ATPase [Thermodesulfobacteriota bacterium]
MQLNENILRNPLRGLGYGADDILSVGAFGAVAARAGVGKTSFLVQIALNAMLRNKRVLHISLEHPVKKVNLWYQDVFQHLSEYHGLKNTHPLWEAILPFRFIMTLQVDGFSVPRLVERLKDLTEQGIFKPDMIIIDGLPFDGTARGILAELKPIAEDGMSVWFTVRTHRHEAPAPDGLPAQLTNIKDFFEVIIALQPEGGDILVRNLKGGNGIAESVVRLNPSSMLIQTG